MVVRTIRNRGGARPPVVAILGDPKCQNLTDFVYRSIISSGGRYELGSTQDLPLQCDFWALYVRLVGALYFQYFGDCINGVRSAICYSILQELLLFSATLVLGSETSSSFLFSGSKDSSSPCCYPSLFGFVTPLLPFSF
ncbi:hypothetical protein RJT34_03859 [Clitoria ternatea]|uniref:Uncharacterized protein n=1 Tax=Clitoria ternatea TaxID=43366 RepID=A0AAN9KLH9_CLITE